MADITADDLQVLAQRIAAHPAYAALSLNTCCFIHLALGPRSSDAPFISCMSYETKS